MCIQTVVRLYWPPDGANPTVVRVLSSRPAASPATRNVTDIAHGHDREAIAGRAGKAPAVRPDAGIRPQDALGEDRYFD